MLKKIIMSYLIAAPVYATNLFYAPSELICSTPNIESCFTTGGSLNGWQLKALNDVKIGTYKINVETLKASAPNE